jgi:hypothetical protein
MSTKIFNIGISTCNLSLETIYLTISFSIVPLSIFWGIG